MASARARPRLARARSRRRTRRPASRPARRCGMTSHSCGEISMRCGQRPPSARCAHTHTRQTHLPNPRQICRQISLPSHVLPRQAADRARPSSAGAHGGSAGTALDSHRRPAGRYAPPATQRRTAEAADPPQLSGRGQLRRPSRTGPPAARIESPRALMSPSTCLRTSTRLRTPSWMPPGELRAPPTDRVRDGMLAGLRRAPPTGERRRRM